MSVTVVAPRTARTRQSTLLTSLLDDLHCTGTIGCAPIQTIDYPTGQNSHHVCSKVCYRQTSHPSQHQVAQFPLCSVWPGLTAGAALASRSPHQLLLRPIHGLEVYTRLKSSAHDASGVNTPNIRPRANPGCRVNLNQTGRSWVGEYPTPIAPLAQFLEFGRLDKQGQDLGTPLNPEAEAIAHPMSFDQPLQCFGAIHSLTIHGENHITPA